MTGLVDSHAPERPRRRPSVLSHPVAEELLIFAPETDTGFSLNGPARAIWELCDGRLTVPEISEALGERFGEPPDRLFPDVRATVDRLGELALLEVPQLDGS